MRHFYENHHFLKEACVALNQLVSLFYLFVARGGRKRGNRRTDGQTKYRNPRCACAPRVKNPIYGLKKEEHIGMV